jgi:hypothetical protein
VDRIRVAKIVRARSGTPSLALDPDSAYQARDHIPRSAHGDAASIKPDKQGKFIIAAGCAQDIESLGKVMCELAREIGSIGNVATTSFAVTDLKDIPALIEVGQLKSGRFTQA